jgi:hypothetical protein
VGQALVVDHRRDVDGELPLGGPRIAPQEMLQRYQTHCRVTKKLQPL